MAGGNHSSANPIRIRDLQEGINQFAQEYVGNKAYRPRWPHEPKIVHDALWGTIRLQPWEIALLDLPLIQRLRQIRQTSLVNYVFPGCNHSRFDHSLGVLHQTQKLCEAVNSLSPKGRKRFDADTINDLRLAALLHDCGHGCFSHISENVYAHCADIEAATEDDGPYPNCHPHEVLGALLLKSGPVVAYVDELNKHYRVRLRVDRAACWVLGLPEDNDKSLLYRAQVINGPFDADKLDYIFRDAHFSGLPLSLDLDRLWASCSVERLPEAKASILTIHQSSAMPLEQILFNKINLFTVVYQHPKVRAAEAMFQAVVEYVRDHRMQIASRHLRLATDFLWLDDSVFFAEALRRSKDHLLHKMIHDMVYRRHFVRALTISRDTVKTKEGPYEQVRMLNHETADAYRQRRALAREIGSEAGLRDPVSTHHVWLDLPPDPPMGGADTTYVRTPGGGLRKLSDLFPLDYWSTLYRNHKWHGHVFCPPEYQQAVYDAAKAVFKRKYGLEFEKSAGEMSHVRKP